MSDYEGWKNKETFEVAFCLSNTLYRKVLTWMQGQGVIHPNSARYFVESNLPAFDGIDLALVDWTEIAEELTTINDEAHA